MGRTFELFKGHEREVIPKVEISKGLLIRVGSFLFRKVFLSTIFYFQLYK